MTKKDYIIIAKVVNTTANIWIEALAKWKKSNHADKYEKIDGINKILASLDVIRQGFSHEFIKDNPRFDAERFRKECGLPDIKNNEIYK